MPAVDFTCPKCGEEAEATVPASGSRVKCPSCGAVVRVVAPTHRTPSLEVPEGADDETEEEPRAKHANAPQKHPRRTKDQNSRPGGIPVWVWVGGGVGLLAVVGVVLALTLGGTKGDPQAKNGPAPVVPPGPPRGPGPVVPPKKNPPQTDPIPKTDPVPNPKVEPPETAPPGADLDEGWPVLPPRKRPVETADAPSRTAVRWYAPPAEGRPLVVLDAPHDPFPRGAATHRGPLARELGRQAVSLAAREEFGATTRDALLSEPPGNLAGYALTATFELTWVVVPGTAAVAALSTGEGAARREVWRAEVPLPAAETVDYVRLAVALEEAARTRLADGLARETKGARRAVGAGAAPAETEAGLKAANYFDAFAAVRRLHAAGSASPANCVGLARGYAHLGLLTTHLPLPVAPAFKARALLYAHRAAALKAPAGLWGTAYASSAVGLHAQALEQVKGADPASRPAWARTVEPVCRFDHAALGALAKDPTVGPIAGVFWFVAAHNTVAPTHPIGIGTEVVQGTPDCFRVADRVIALYPLGVGRALTESAPVRLSNALAARLSTWSDLPPAATAALGKVRARDAVAERALLGALDAAPGPGEPALGVIAAVVREERVEHLRTMMGMLEGPLGLPAAATAGAVREALPFLADHPSRAIFARVLEQPGGPPRPPDATGVPESTLYGAVAVEEANSARLDDTEDELRRHLPRVKPDASKAFVARYLRASPHAPAPRVRQIESDWAVAEQEAAGWEREFAAHPAVLAALGRKYLELKREGDAERVLLAAVKLSPDNTSYFRLVAIYGTVRKDEAKMLSVMEERLKQPDYGMDNARMRVRIAEVYAQRKDFATALKYAERAAEDSGAAWAMQPTIHYASQVGDKEKAVLWGKRMTERYKN